jgi:hypothetical protein
MRCWKRVEMDAEQVAMEEQEGEYLKKGGCRCIHILKIVLYKITITQGLRFQMDSPYTKRNNTSEGK